jgi:hypothetical protein
VVGDARGAIYQSTDLVTFRELEKTTFGANILSFLPFRDGFLWGGWAGDVGQYLAGLHSFCTPMQIAGSDVNFVATVGDWIVIGGSPAVTVDMSSVTILKPSP